MRFGITAKVTLLAVLLASTGGAVVGVVGYRALGQALQARSAGPDAGPGDAGAAVELREAREQIVVVTLALVAAGALLAVVLSRLLVRPLLRVADAADSVASGAAAPDLPTQRFDEIGLLARAFETMRRRVSDRSRALEASERRVQEILESAPDAMVVVDRAGHILIANSPARRMFGYETDALVGRLVEMLMPERHRVAHAGHVSAYAQGPAARPMGRGLELMGRRRDGKEFPVEISLSPIATDAGTITVSTIRDITQRQRQQSDLIAAREEALSASRAKSDFLARMSHEIRTPMNAIVGMAELLQKTPLNAQQQKYVRLFQAAGDNLLTIINDILDLSKIESGQLEVHRRSFDVIDVAERVMDMMAVNANARGLNLLLHIKDDVPGTVRGDPDRLAQVLVNLLSNAIKFTREGEVVLRLQRDPDAADDGGLWFSVSDTGIGIDTDDLERIFESFTQVDASATRTVRGTGLGLSISRQLVELMNGHIWVESQEGAGSTFHVTIPFEGAPQSEVAPHHPTQVNFEALKVLVADENATTRMILTEMLNGWRATCREQASGAEALYELFRAAGREEAYDVLIVSASLPDVGGFSLVETLRKRLGPRAPRVVMTASDLAPGDADRLEALGVQRCLINPFKRRDVFEALSVTIGSVVTKATADAVRPRIGVATDSPLRILLAEDTEENREIVKAYLSETPCRLVEVEDGSQAVEAFRRDVFDIVLMDIQMPVLDGYAAVEAIRQWEREAGRPRTPIIALTAYALEAEKEKSRRAGCNAHLGKPVRQRDLLVMIRRLTGRRAGNGEAAAGVDPLLRAQVPAYLARRRAELDLLRQAAGEADFDAIACIGHKLHGHAGTFGLPELGQVGAALEQAAADRDRAEVDRLIGRAEAVLRPANL